MEVDGRESNANPIYHQLKISLTTKSPKLPSLIEERDLNGDLLKAALRWSVYRFPVKYTPID